jgi:hypothetical protein
MQDISLHWRRKRQTALEPAQATLRRPGSLALVRVYMALLTPQRRKEERASGYPMFSCSQTISH